MKWIILYVLSVIMGIMLGCTDSEENSVPKWSGSNADEVSILENLPLDNLIKVIPEATDADGDDLTYRMEVEADVADYFTFDPETRELKAGVKPFDYEQGPNIYRVLIIASDGVSEGTYSLTVRIRAVEDSANVVWVAENLSPDRLIMQIPEATDENEDPIPYKLESDFDGRFVFNPETFELRTGTVALDFETETSYEVVLLVANDGTDANRYLLTVNLVDANDIPTWETNSQEFPLSENIPENPISWVKKIPEAIDDDGDALTYRMEVKADVADYFTFDPETRELKAGVKSFDFEQGPNIYRVLIIASDGVSEGTYFLTVKIGDVDDSANVGMVWVAENLLPDYLITHVPEATDENEDPIPYKLESDFDGRFVFNPETFELRTGTKRLDYEMQARYEVVLLVANDGTDANRYLLTVNLVDVNDIPTWETNSQELSLSENIPENTVLWKVPAAFDDDGNALTYRMEVKVDAADYFTFEPENRELKAGVKPFDFEQGPNIYRVLIIVSDGVYESTYSLTAVIQDVNDTPAWDNNPTNLSLSENTFEDTLLLEIPAAFDDDGDALTYRMEDDLDGRFVFDKNSRQLSAMANQFDYETETNHQVVILANDGEQVGRYEVVVNIIDDVDYLDPSIVVWESELEVIGYDYALIEDSDSQDSDSQDSDNLSSNLVSGTFKSNTHLLINDVYYVFKEGTDVRFHPDGAVEQGHLAAKAIWLNDEYQVPFVFQSNEVIIMHPDGIISSGFLLNETRWINQEMNEEFVSVANELMLFYPDGKIKKTVLIENHTPIEVWAHDFVFKEVSFDTNGGIIKGLLAAEVPDVYGTYYSNDSYLLFYADDGQIAWGNLDPSDKTNASIIRAWMGDRPPYIPLDEVVWDDILDPDYTEDVQGSVNLTRRFLPFGQKDDLYLLAGGGVRLAIDPVGSLIIDTNGVLHTIEGRSFGGELIWINNGRLHFNGNADLHFHSNGMIKSGNLVDGSTWTNAAYDDMVFYPVLHASFYSDGKVKDMVLIDTHSSVEVGEHNFNFSSLRFDTNGKIILGLLSHSFSAPVGTYEEDTYILFYADNGEIRSGNHSRSEESMSGYYGPPADSWTGERPAADD